MPQIYNENWLDQNADRAYPLVDDATRLATDGVFVLPNDLLLDLRLTAAAGYDPTAFYVSTTQAFGSGLVITLAIQSVGDCATVTIPLDSFVTQNAYTIVGLPGFDDIGGTAVIGDAAGVLAASSGVYHFVLAATRLLPTLIVPGRPAVSSLTIRDGFGVDQTLTGAVVLTAGENANLSVSGQTVTVGMNTGVIVEDPCGCKDTGGRNRTSIKSINGVTPDADGNIELVPVGCVQIETDTSQLKLKDGCAQPCCGTPELQLLADAAKNLQQYLATQATRSAQLETALRTVQDYLVN